MSTEKLGLVQEAQDRKERYGHFAYRAPIAAGVPKPEARAAASPQPPNPSLKPAKGGDIQLANLYHQLAAKDRYIERLEEQLGVPAEPVKIIDVQRAFLALLAQAGYRLNGRSVELHDLQAPTRHRNVAWPRHVCMDAIRRICRCSFPMIGRSFGKRDHTTVMHALNRAPHHLDAVPVLAGVHANLLAMFAGK